LSTSTTSEPPEKRRKLDEAEKEDKPMQAENEPTKNSSSSANDSKTTDSVSPQSRRRKKTLNPKDDEGDVEKWAKAIIKYHQQTEDLRTRYASCYCSQQVFYVHLFHLNSDLIISLIFSISVTFKVVTYSIKLFWP